MTDPNQFSQADILAIRERIKGWLTPAFVKAIDAGELDGFGLWDRAAAIHIQQREQGEAGDQ